MKTKLEQALESGTIQFPRGLTGEERRAFIKEKLVEDKHYQNALSLYEMIISNVEETAVGICKHTGKMQHLDSARIGVMSAWIDRLVHKLPDWEIEYMKDLMKIVVDRE